ncbi:MAG: hypothetical protein AB7G87_05085 [Clostridia bacterium]
MKKFTRSINGIEEEISYIIRHAAPSAGLVLTSTNGLENGAKLENYKEMMRARKE